MTSFLLIVLNQIVLGRFPNSTHLTIYIGQEGLAARKQCTWAEECLNNFFPRNTTKILFGQFLLNSLRYNISKFHENPSKNKSCRIFFQKVYSTRLQVVHSTWFRERIRYHQENCWQKSLAWNIQEILAKLIGYF